MALNHTTVANVLFMQAVSPIAAALIAWAALHEAVSRRTGVAMVVALVGVGLMVGGPGGSQGLGLGALGADDGGVRPRRRDHPSPPRHLDGARALPVAGLVFVAFAPFAHPATVGAATCC